MEAGKQFYLMNDRLYQHQLYQCSVKDVYIPKIAIS